MSLLVKLYQKTKSAIEELVRDSDYESNAGTN